jgi:glycosyltransferase involved in cell wall biosynthesis
VTPVRIALAAAGLGLGGTEKGLVTHAVHLDRSRFEPRVVTWLEGGPRQADLEAAGIPVSCASGDPETLAEMLSGVEVVHVYRHGFHEPLLVDACRRASVRVLIETNIFGAVDRSPDEALFNCHLFLSQMCLLRYREWVGFPPDFAARHRVGYLPTDVERLRALAPDRRTAKIALGFDPDRPVVGRIGRAADLKWRDLLVDMAPHLVALVPDVQLLYVGMTPAKQRRAGRLGILERSRVHEAVPDERRLALYYAACDVAINAAAIGESQGLAIAEAMALHTPVVTCSTPWADNAQVELVDHGVDGWIANHPRPFAEAVGDLLLNDERRRAFGDAGASKIERWVDPARLTRQLEDLYAHHLDSGGTAPAWWPDVADFERFAEEYPARASREFRPMTQREQIEARIDRGKDRFRSLRSSAQMIGAPLIARARRTLGLDRTAV